MPFADAFRELNGLKRRGVIKDYAVIGAVAATAYMEPVFTEDLDVIVLVESDEEYLEAFQRVASEAQGQEGMHHVIGGIPIQMFPSTVMPLYRDAVENARQVRIGNIRAKFATAEHLILLYLLAFRERDRHRVRQLAQDTDLSKVAALLDQFDDKDLTLTSRFQELCGPGLL